MHVLSYQAHLYVLQGTKSKALVFHRGVGTLCLKAYFRFAGKPEVNDKPMRSTSGLIVNLHGVGPLYWKTQLQPVTATSIKEAEYCSAGLCSRVMIGFSQSSSEIQSHNQPALYSLKARLSHSKSRHITIQFHYVRDLVQDREQHFKYCLTVNIVPAAQLQSFTMSCE